jgi:hypothetical protein
MGCTNCVNGSAVEAADGSCACTENPVAAFNCFVGTPRLDVNGQWFCDTSSVFINEPLPKPTTRAAYPKGLRTPPVQNQCATLTAPTGYKYIYDGIQCVLVVDYDTDNRLPVPVILSNPNNTITPATSNTTPVAATPNALSNLSAQISSVYQNHKSLFLVGGALLAWHYVNGGKGKHIL